MTTFRLNTNPSSTEAFQLLIDEDEFPDTYLVEKSGLHFEINFPTNGGVPYNWELTQKPESGLLLDELHSKEKDADLLGGPVKIIQLGKVVKTGTYCLTFTYQPLDKDEEPEYIYEVIVTADEQEITGIQVTNVAKKK